MRIWPEYIFGTLIAFITTSCVEPFEIESIGLEDLLVVEGFISDEMKEHRVVLTRTTEIDQLDFLPETGAKVQIAQVDGAVISLQESEQGVYLTPASFAGVVGESYQLLIDTRDGRKYASDPVVLRSSPTIDSIYGKFTPVGSSAGRSGIQILLTTSNPASQNQFFRWEWEETYEINTPFNSKFDWIQGNMVVRREIPVDRCFATNNSTDILLKSTEIFEKNVVTEFPIAFLPTGSDRLKVKYSLLVKQYNLTQEAYLFWEGLRIQNETQGSLFDVQPAAVVGNIRSLNNQGEAVLGYFDASQVSTIRRFFTPEDFLDQGFVPPSDNINCLLDTVATNEIGVYMESLLDSPTPREIYDVVIDQFLVAPRFCTDCSGRGEIDAPDFWE